MFICLADEGAGVAEEVDDAGGAGDASMTCNAGVAVVATGVKEMDGCGRDAREAEVVAMARAGETEGEVAKGGDNKTGVQNGCSYLPNQSTDFAGMASLFQGLQ